MKERSVREKKTGVLRSVQHREVAEEKAYSELPVRLDTKQQEKDQRHRAN